MLKGIAVIVSFLLALLAAVPGNASAQQPIVGLPLVEEAEPEIDGAWTTDTEWSGASELMVNYTDGTRMAIRGMHDSDFVYVMLEMPDDYVVDGHGAICFDTQSDGGTYLGMDDYCFVVGTTFREYHGDGRTTLMQQAPLDQFVVGQRGLSDSASPLYSTNPHMTYEFRIPLDYLGSEKTQFGFYVSFDTRGHESNYTYYYSWPDFKTAEYLRTASPRSWGIASLTSDASVPEFPVPVIGALAGIVGLVAILSRTRFIKF
jgi:hypothetical protein